MDSTVVIVLATSFICFVFTMLTVIDVITKDFDNIQIKAFWGFISLIPFIGWIVYLMFGFRKGKRKK